MHLELTFVEKWTLLKFPDRIDALNFRDFAAALGTQINGQSRLALDFRRIQFVNFQGIRMVHQLAIELGRTGGVVALVGPSEKMKRQFVLFASLEPFQIFSASDWSRLEIRKSERLSSVSSETRGSPSLDVSGGF